MKSRGSRPSATESCHNQGAAGFEARGNIRSITFWRASSGQLVPAGKCSSPPGSAVGEGHWSRHCPAPVGAVSSGRLGQAAVRLAAGRRWRDPGPPAEHRQGGRRSWRQGTAGAGGQHPAPRQLAGLRPLKAGRTPLQRRQQTGGASDRPVPLKQDFPPAGRRGGGCDRSGRPSFLDGGVLGGSLNWKSAGSIVSGRSRTSRWLRRFQSLGRSSQTSGCGFASSSPGASKSREEG